MQNKVQCSIPMVFDNGGICLRIYPLETLMANLGYISHIKMFNTKWTFCLLSYQSFIRRISKHYSHSGFCMWEVKMFISCHSRDKISLGQNFMIGLLVTFKFRCSMRFIIICRETKTGVMPLSPICGLHRGFWEAAMGTRCWTKQADAIKLMFL